jgi:hypothetical protein
MQSKTFSSQPPTNSVSSSKNDDQFNVGASDYNLSNAAHPIACVATVLFKALAIFLYFCSFIVSATFL